MPRLTLSFKESLYREILNGRDNDPANLHPARRDQPAAGLGLFSPLNWAEITMAQLFLWREMLKNGGEGSSRTKRGMRVAKRFCQKTGRGASEGDANPPTDGTKNVGQTRRLSRKGLLAIQSGDRVREAEGGGGIDRLNMTAGNLLWSQLSAGSQQPNQTRSKWRFEMSGFSTPS